MFIDAKEISANTLVNADICIVGAGVAGLSIAREFINTQYNVCVIEGGGLHYEPQSQALYEGENQGQDYWSLESARIRFFGGTGNHWGGYSLPLEIDDFEEREWVPNSGWPMRKSDLDPFYDRARDVLKLNNPSFSAKAWGPKGIKHLPFDENKIENRVMQMSPYSEVDTPFGASYQAEFKNAKNIFVYLHANLLDIISTENASEITSLKLSTLSKKEFKIKAKNYILALGGIENARQLLLANKSQKTGLGNQNDLVGRYFADHPFLSSNSKLLVTNEDVDTTLFSRGLIKSQRISAYLTLSPELRKKENLLTSRFTFEPLAWSSAPQGPQTLNSIWQSVRRSRLPKHLPGKAKNIIKNFDNVLSSAFSAYQNHKLLTARYISTEVIPNPSSRVMLNNKTDALGQKQVTLDWQVDGKQEIDSIKKSLKLLAIEMGRADVGRLNMDTKRIENWPDSFSLGMHHMGTTRMHNNPKSGVVDANSKVHNISNLYIAGSSVFPTYGHANPTFTIVALALRLADHVKKVMI